MIKLIYFVGEGVFTPVLDSQVLIPLRLIAEKYPQVEVSLLNLTSRRHFKTEKAQKRMAEIKDAVPSSVKVVDCPRPWAGIIFQEYIWAQKLEKVIINRGYKIDDAIIVHCRGHSTAAAAAVLKRKYKSIKIVMDIRGDSFDELSNAGLLKRYLRHRSNKLFKLAASNTDAMNTVSDVLAQRLFDTGLIRHDLPRTVIGCCVDTEKFKFDPEQRQKSREQLGLSDKFVICYCGAVSHWQKPDLVAELFSMVINKIKNAHLLVVSKQGEKIVEYLNRFGVDKDFYTLKSARHDEVAHYLMSADVGLLLREDTITNRVASPVKFAEYLRCGLGVILTPYLGDFGRYVKENNAGATVTLPLTECEVEQGIRLIKQQIDHDGPEYKKKCSQTAERLLSWDNNLLKLWNLYESLF